MNMHICENQMLTTSEKIIILFLFIVRLKLLMLVKSFEIIRWEALQKCKVLFIDTRVISSFLLTEFQPKEVGWPCWLINSCLILICQSGEGSLIINHREKGISWPEELEKTTSFWYFYKASNAQGHRNFTCHVVYEPAQHSHLIFFPHLKMKNTECEEKHGHYLVAFTFKHLIMLQTRI